MHSEYLLQLKTCQDAVLSACESEMERHKVSARLLANPFKFNFELMYLNCVCVSWMNEGSGGREGGLGRDGWIMDGRIDRGMEGWRERIHY